MLEPTPTYWSSALSACGCSGIRGRGMQGLCLSEDPGSKPLGRNTLSWGLLHLHASWEDRTCLAPCSSVLSLGSGQAETLSGAFYRAHLCEFTHRLVILSVGSVCTVASEPGLRKIDLSTCLEVQLPLSHEELTSSLYGQLGREQQGPETCAQILGPPKEGGCGRLT